MLLNTPNVIYIMSSLIALGRAPYDDKSDDEVRKQIFSGMRPLKPSRCSDEL